MAGSSNYLQRSLSLGRKIVFISLIMGLFYSVVEYYVSRWTGDPKAYLPLLVRVMMAATGVGMSIALLEIATGPFFRRKPFFYIVFLRALLYAVIITLWLVAINGVWESSLQGITFMEGLAHYLASGFYLVNLVTVMVLFSLVLGIYQVNTLHRKGELWRFILGRYHRPREIERMFCFIDLNASTTLAEKMGHLTFGAFLKDYYESLTEAIRYTDAEVYQYVGDEIVLSWPVKVKTDTARIIASIFMMEDLVEARSRTFLQHYGHVPEFKAGLHGGTVLVTWVGEVRREILYMGDVLNTTARIRGECQRLDTGLLVSDYIRQKTTPAAFSFELADELILRGKEQPVRVYRVARLKRHKNASFP
jgi:adenylate cyclase